MHTSIWDRLRDKHASGPTCIGAGIGRSMHWGQACIGAGIRTSFGRSMHWAKGKSMHACIRGRSIQRQTKAHCEEAWSRVLLAAVRGFGWGHAAGPLDALILFKRG